MQGNRFLAGLRARLAAGPGQSLGAAAVQMLGEFFYGGSGKNRAAPFVRDANNLQRFHVNFVIASLPCWLLGMWNVGYQAQLSAVSSAAGALPGWRGSVLAALGIAIQDSGGLVLFCIGLLYFLPLLLLLFVVAAFWSGLFSVLRRRDPDLGLLAFAWLFALLLPAGAPPLQVALGASFGLVFGKHIFGGSGYYLINPLVVGMVFLWLAYPAAVSLEPAPPAGMSWMAQFVGARPGGMGTASTLGCVLGAAYLLLSATASWRIMAGAMLGVWITLQSLALTAAASIGGFGFAEVLVSGMLAFGIVFLATDPVAACMTNRGRWLYGALVGVLAIILQVTNAAVGEPVLFAIFIASMLAPLLDSAVIARHRRRRRRRLGEVANG